MQEFLYIVKKRISGAPLSERRERLKKEFPIQITGTVSAGMPNFWGQLSS